MVSGKAVQRADSSKPVKSNAGTDHKRRELAPVVEVRKRPVMLVASAILFFLWTVWLIVLAIRLGQ